MMTQMITSDARLMQLKPIEVWLDLLRLAAFQMTRSVCKLWSCMSRYLNLRIIGSNHHVDILNSDPRTSELVGKSNGLPLRINPVMPKCLLVSDRCAADMVSGDCA